MFHLRNPDQERLREQCVHPTGGVRPFTDEDIAKGLVSRFYRVADLYSDRVALSEGQRSIAYSVLRGRVNRLIVAIKKRLPGEGQPVALHFGREMDIAPAILGVLGSGHYYVPIDRANPIRWKRRLLEVCESPLILTNQAGFEDTLKISGKIPVIAIDSLGGCNGCDVQTTVPFNNGLPACVLFTSGSTGKSKGIIHSHQSLTHAAGTWSHTLAISDQDRLTALASFSTVGMIYDLLGAVLNGARLYFYDLPRLGDSRLVEWLEREEITIFRSVTSIYRRLIAVLKNRTGPMQLRAIFAGGEAVEWKDVVDFKQKFSRNCLFLTGLASTETATGYALHYFDHSSKIGEGPPPVGFPFGNMRVSIDQPDPLTGEGEICVTGRFLSPGYWCDPELDSQRYRVNEDENETRTFFSGDLGRFNDDGSLQWLGRRDHQVKVRGNRVNLSDIEHILLGLGGISDAAVVICDRGQGTELAAFLEVEDRETDVTRKTRQRLAERAPSYMIPQHWQCLPCIPRTISGKIDRLALARRIVSEPSAGASAPSSDLESKLSGIWYDCLATSPSMGDGDFFEHGGDSLKAMQLMDQIKESLHVELPPAILLEQPRFQDLLHTVRDHLTVPNSETLKTD